MTDVTLTHEPPADASPTGGFPESTLSFKLDVQGLALTWTLRGTDASMAARLPRVLAYLQKLQGRLAQEGTRHPEPMQALDEREDWCPIHQHAMVRQENSRGVWYSHRVPGEGYCKGTRRKAGA